MPTRKPPNHRNPFLPGMEFKSKQQLIVEQKLLRKREIAKNKQIRTLRFSWRRLESNWPKATNAGRSVQIRSLYSNAKITVQSTGENPENVLDLTFINRLVGRKNLSREELESIKGATYRLLDRLGVFSS